MAAWPGDLPERAERSHRDLRGALIREVLRRTAGRTHARLPSHDLRELTRFKVTPMVQGLFPTAEREAVLQLLERSVIFITSDNLEQLLMNQRWNHTAWMLANLHLGTLGVDLLDPDAKRLVGLSEEAICFVSPVYFSEPDPTSDFVVHEVAHIFHNRKRRAAGLPETRRSEWLSTSPSTNAKRSPTHANSMPGCWSIRRTPRRGAAWPWRSAGRRRSPTTVSNLKRSRTSCSMRRSRAPAGRSSCTGAAIHREDAHRFV